MKLHIFNPEHEICFAFDKARFTPSNNVVKMRKHLAFLPYLWADEDDYVLVDDIEFAYKAVAKLSDYVHNRVRFVGVHRLKSLISERVRSGVFDLQAVPWGWDKAVKHQLSSLGWPEEHLPSDEALEQLRQLSHRRTAKAFLESIDSEFTAHEVTNIPELLSLIERYDNVVLKAPWSCSGRGVRFVNKENCTTTHLRWADNIIAQQGSVMLEPHYDKVLDFALEFNADASGVTFCGYSLFDTAFTCYNASLITSEKNKRAILEQYLPAAVLDQAISQAQSFLRSLIVNSQLSILKSPFPIGIDMMVVKSSEGYKLHPCVEINFRRTMGHVALCFPPSILDPDRRMQIEFARTIELKIK